MQNLMPLMMPMMLGGLIIGFITWFASFGMAYCALIWWREHRARRLAENRSRRYYQMPKTEVVSKNGTGRKQDAAYEFELTDNDGATSAVSRERK